MTNFSDISLSLSLSVLMLPFLFLRSPVFLLVSSVVTPFVFGPNNANGFRQWDDNKCPYGCECVYVRMRMKDSLSL